MSTSSPRLNVLFLPHEGTFRDPWLSDMRSAIGDRHNLRVFDQNQPWGPQFEAIDVVVDQGGVHSLPEMADVATAVKLWQILGTGFEKFPLALWREKSIPVANTPGQFSASALAECALMFMLMLARRWHECEANFRSGIVYKPMGRELEGARLLLIGFGASAQALAARVAPLGVRITAIDLRPITRAECKQFHLERTGTPDDLNDLLPLCDYVSLHLHLNAETRHLLNTPRLSLLKPSASIINISRGALIDQDALYQALKSGRLGGAGLDVVATEPADPSDPLFSLPNVVVAPHISGNTDGTSRRRAACVAANIDRVSQGLEPLYLLQPEPQTTSVDIVSTQQLVVN